MMLYTFLVAVRRTRTKLQAVDVILSMMGFTLLRAWVASIDGRDE
jgi:hypothetical protein